MKRIAMTVVLALAAIALVATTAGATDGTATLSTTLTGAAEVPGPGDPDGMGSATIELRIEAHDAAQVCWTIEVENITLPAAAAHIHVGDRHTAGPVVVTLSPPDGHGNANGCTAADPALVQAIIDRPDQYYVNVHTSDFPDGAVRGQLG